MGLNPKLKRKQWAAKVGRIALTVDDPSSSPGPTAPPSTTDPEQRRLDLASRWLFGYVAPEKSVLIPGPNGPVEKPGLNVRKRPPIKKTTSEPDEPSDFACRAALAELLWNGELPPEMQWRLASMFAPDGHELADDEEYLTISARGRGKARGLNTPEGRRTAAGRKLQMAYFVNAVNVAGYGLSEAMAATAIRFAVTERTVEDAWAEHEWAFRKGGTDDE